jgi:hypothetical protein
MACSFISALVALGVNIAVIFLGIYPEKFTTVNLFHIDLEEKIPLQSFFYTFLWISTLLNMIVVAYLLRISFSLENGFSCGDSSCIEGLITAIMSELVWNIITLFILVTISSRPVILIFLGLKILTFVLTAYGKITIAVFIEILSRIAIIIIGALSIQMEAENLFYFNLAGETTKRRALGTYLIVFATPGALAALVPMFLCGRSYEITKIYNHCEAVLLIYNLIPLLTLGSTGFILSVIPLKGFMILMSMCCPGSSESSGSNDRTTPNFGRITGNSRSTRESQPLIHGRSNTHHTRIVKVYNINERR